MSRSLTRLLVGAVVAFGLLAAPPAGADEDPGEGSVFGIVRADDTAGPLAGITVTVHDSGNGDVLGSDVTDADGSYDIQDIPLGEGGQRSVLVAFTDLDPARNAGLTAYRQLIHPDVLLTEGNDTPGAADVDGVLARQAYLLGRVTDGAGEPVTGCVEVQSVVASWEVGLNDVVIDDVAQVDAQGRWVLADVPSDPLTLVFSDCDEQEPTYQTEILTNVGLDAQPTDITLLRLEAGETGFVDASLDTTPPQGSHCAVQPFPDVTSANDFCDDIFFMAELGFAGGYPDGQFKSANPISRQAMAAFLYRFANQGQDPPETDCEEAPFDDVPATSPFCAHIEWLLEQDITAGFGAGEVFQPTAPVSRQAMAAFLYRLEHDGQDPSPTTCESSPFTDVPEGSNFCAHIEWLSSARIAEGYTDGTFKPSAPISRQAMAAFLHRFFHLPPPAA